MKLIENIRDFRKITRKYWKRHAKRSSYWSPTMGKRVTSWWVADIWCAHVLRTPEELESKIFLENLRYEVESQDIPAALEKIKGSLGKEVSWKSADGPRRIFVGPSVFNNGAGLTLEDPETGDLEFKIFYPDYLIPYGSVL